MEELAGGRESAIYRDGEVVYRPLQPWSPTIHLILKHLERENVAECPRFLGVNKEQEVLSFVAGNTYNYPLVGAIGTDDALMSAAKLLRKIHDSTALLLDQLDVKTQKWMLEPREPFEVICHGDFTPYNVALFENTVVGVFDFDTSHPASKIWDLAYSVYCWSPFKTDNNDKLGSISEQVVRAKLFSDSYGASESERNQLADVMVQRLEALVSFMRSEAENGNESFAENIEQGHLQAYLNDIEYITDNKQKKFSAHCATNKQFKSDSARLAFLVWVKFSVYGGQIVCRGRVLHTLIGRYASEYPTFSRHFTKLDLGSNCEVSYG